MPFLMQLQGPGSSRMRAGHLRFSRRTLHGVGGAIALHPIVFLGGLAIGGYLAYKKIAPFAFLHGKSGRAWGEHRMTMTREKALSGRKRRRR